MKMVTLRFEAVQACRAHLARAGELNREMWNLTVPISEMPKGLPYGPNARNADPKAKTVKAMRETLKEEPEEFFFFNNGIMLVAERLQAKSNKAGRFDVTIVLSVPDAGEGDFLGHGILNGGHTYYALMESQEDAQMRLNLEHALVSVSVATGIHEDEIAAISRARNTSEKVSEYALLDLKRGWKIIEDNLPEECYPYVAFKGNEKYTTDDGEEEAKPFTVVDAVRRIALINNDLYNWSERKHPKVAYTGKGSLEKSWKPEKYTKVAPLLRDVLWLEEKILEEHVARNRQGESDNGRKNKVITNVSGCSKKPSLLMNGAKVDITVAEPFVFPVIAAFRVFLEPSGHWKQPLPSIWSTWGHRLINALWEEYAKRGQSSAAIFGRSDETWGSLVSEIVYSQSASR